MRKHLFSIAIILYGLVFIGSALLKFIPPEPFELYVFSWGIVSWNTATILVRILIFWELLLGGIIIIARDKKYPIYASLLTLVFFSFLLIYQIFFRDTENCFCLGETMPMTPLQSLYKNLVLIAFAFVFLKKQSYKIPYAKILLSIYVAVSFYFSFLFIKPDFWIKDTFAQNTTGTNIFPVEIIQKYVSLDLSKGKKVLCFMNPACRYCHLAAQKISIMDGLIENDAEIIYLFYGNPRLMEVFWKASDSKKFPFFFLPNHIFFKINGKGTPTIFFVENGKIDKIVGYRTLFEDDFNGFVKK